jgi:hypothetical protein
MTKQNKKITAQTNLAQILEQPGAIDVLSRYQLPCLSCPFAAYEMGQLSLGEVAEQYGLPLAEILAELNQKTD